VNDPRADAARSAVEESLDRHFGDGGIEHLIAAALAAGLDRLRDDDGTLDGEEVEALVSHYDLDELAEPLASAADADEVTEAVEEHLVDEALDAAIETMVGTVTDIGGMDSSSFAVMTAGSITHHVLVRGDHFTTFDSGSEEGFDFYSMGGRHAVADDLGFRRAQLTIAAEIGGLRPGLWLADEADLDEELREMTMGGDGLGWLLGDVVYRDEDVDEAVDDWWATLAKTAQLSEEAARTRIRELVTGDQPRDVVERDLLWELWKDVRPR
jgi:hypothetical protein